MRSMLLEFLEGRYDAGSTGFCIQYTKKGEHQRFGSIAYVDAIVDDIVYDAIWIEIGSEDMREHAANLDVSSGL